ncbi:hypothetical protein AALA90_09970 [Lachnospiraceae bacterium 38-10]
MPRDKDAEERARREARRAAIRAQIRVWEGKRAVVEGQIRALSGEQSNLNGYLGEWSTQKSIYSGNPLLSEVVIVNLFEGVCADEIKEEFTNCIAEMDQTYSGVSGLNGNVGTQISRLQDYLAVINAKISALYSELASI